ncbi:membrane lipoprotein lipid attachment site-containing protein [Brevibacillus ruminantium]|uniref:Membrane lipoprotein lipid attachment site-containing protein n=1 Tax=Brevibacillus ruminantium TaxID=2950604 RepID=A0ABY4WFR4_9BACL|nr:membrane lipoprotein lipid attachment site-containing protein [Brevibacillus ruminantium]USG65671.1 membrane lipoprotein lipid attachment site-containing protein [Brevibacillus ruminantium]
MKKMLFLVTFTLILTGCGGKESAAPDTATINAQPGQSVTDHVQAASQESPQAGEASQQSVEKPEASGEQNDDAKADTFHVENIVSGYEDLIIGAINQKDFSYVKDFLLPDSPVYQEQEKLIEDLGKKGVSLKLIDSRIEDIKESNQPNEYLVDVQTELEITKANETKTKEIKKVYTVLSQDDNLYIKEIKADQTYE